MHALVGENARDDTRITFRRRLRNGELDDKEVEVQVADTAGLQLPTMDIPGMPGSQMGVMNLNEMFGKAFVLAEEVGQVGGLWIALFDGGPDGVSIWTAPTTTAARRCM